MTQDGQCIRVAAIVHNERGGVLCVKHFHRGKPFWTLPGGRPERTETPEDAIVREVVEETGWTIALQGICAVGTLRTGRWEAPKVELIFCATPVICAPPIRQVGEIIMDSQFFHPSEIPASFRPCELLGVLAIKTIVPYIDFILQEEPDE